MHACAFQRLGICYMFLPYSTRNSTSRTANERTSISDETPWYRKKNKTANYLKTCLVGMGTAMEVSGREASSSTSASSPSSVGMMPKLVTPTPTLPPRTPRLVPPKARQIMMTSKCESCSCCGPMATPPASLIANKAGRRAAEVCVLRGFRNRLNACLWRQSTVLEPHEPEVRRTRFCMFLNSC